MKYFKVLIIGLFFVAGCHTIAPSWDTEIDLPLATRTILMSDLDSTAGDTIAILSKTYVTDTMWVKDFLAIDSINRDSMIALTDLGSKSTKDTFPPDTVPINLPVELHPYEIYNATIASGLFNFNLASPINNSFNFLLRDNECSFLPFLVPIKRGANNAVRKLNNSTITPFSSDKLDLIGYFIPLSSPVPDTIDNSDTFALNMQFSNLHFSLFNGRIDTVLTTPIAQYSKDMNYGGNFDPNRMKLKDAWLYIDIICNASAANTPQQLNITLTGMRGVQTKSLYLQLTIDSGEKYTEIKGDSVLNFINMFPESVIVTGTVNLTGNVNIKPTDFVFATIGAKVLFDFNITDTLNFLPDSVRIDVPQQVRDADFIDTRLLLWYDNTIGLKGDLTLFLSKDSTVYGDTIFHKVIQKGNYNYDESLSIPQYLKYKTIWARLLVRFYPDTVVAYVTDKFKIQSLMKIKVKVQ